MFSQTKRSLEDFDNQHDFERMAADILNALGYQSVEPMAPGGGADTGTDIKFRENDAPGMAFVTLEKKVRDKFDRDLAKQGEGEGVIAIFCHVDVSPSLKLVLARQAVAKGYRLEVFDLERLRSLLDSSLTGIRRRYLGIDDEVATRIRSEVRKLLRFPDAIAAANDPPTLLEALLSDALPRRLFDLLMQYEEADIREVPQLGPALHEHLAQYYQFRSDVRQIEDEFMLRIGRSVNVTFPAAWRIYLRYLMMRFAGTTKEQIISWGNFLNYGITWDSAEQLFQKFSEDQDISQRVAQLLEAHDRMVQLVAQLSESPLPV
jgi:hypothetical protein